MSHDVLVANVTTMIDEEVPKELVCPHCEATLEVFFEIDELANKIVEFVKDNLWEAFRKIRR